MNPINERLIMEHINLTPAESALDAAQMPQLIQIYLSNLAARLDPRTVEGYAAKLNYFECWLQEEGPHWRFALTRSRLLALEEWLFTRPLQRSDGTLSYNTRRDVLRRLRQLLRWAFQDGYLSRDYSLWVPSARGASPRYELAPLEALSKLLIAAGDSPAPWRDRCIVALFIGVGLRRAEVAALSVQDIQLYADDSGVAKVIGKRTKANKTGRRDVALDRVTGSYVRAWLEVLDQIYGPLFPSNLNRGEGISPQSVYRVVKRAIGRAGLEDEPGITACHSLRRSYATHAAKAANTNAELDALQRQLGHKSFVMTSQYNLLGPDEIREMVKSPLSRISAGSQPRRPR
ncbi:MAG: site-specific integrase [Caldilineaceae bacterium]